MAFYCEYVLTNVNQPFTQRKVEKAHFIWRFRCKKYLLRCQSEGVSPSQYVKSTLELSPNFQVLFVIPLPRPYHCVQSDINDPYLKVIYSV